MKTLNQKLHNENQYLKEEIQSLKRELNSLQYDEAKFSNDDHNNRVSYYTGLACFNTLITLFNLGKSEIKSKNKLQFEKCILCLMRLRLGVSFSH